MNVFFGDLFRADDVLLKNVRVGIEEVNPPGKLGTWYGSFVRPGNQDFDIASAMKSDTPHTLVLDDGRKGNIIITRASPTDSEVQFQGTGPLQ